MTKYSGFEKILVTVSCIFLVLIIIPACGRKQEPQEINKEFEYPPVAIVLDKSSHGHFINKRYELYIPETSFLNFLNKSDNSTTK
jgi:hypothetical protein